MEQLIETQTLAKELIKKFDTDIMQLPNNRAKEISLARTKFEEGLLWIGEHIRNKTQG